MQEMKPGTIDEEKNIVLKAVEAYAIKHDKIGAVVIWVDQDMRVTSDSAGDPQTVFHHFEKLMTKTLIPAAVQFIDTALDFFAHGGGEKRCRYKLNDTI